MEDHDEAQEREQDRRRARRRVLAYLKRGGRLVREALPAPVGVQWRRASRSGTGFDESTCERILANGCRINGKPHALAVAPEARQGSSVYALAEIVT